MGQPISSVVKVSVIRGTRSITKAGFGTPLLIAHDSPFEGIRSYAGINEVAEDFELDSDEYKAAVRLFSAERKPPIIKIGYAVGESDGGPPDALTPVEMLAKLVDLDLDFYGVIMAAKNDASALEVAQYIETQRKVFYYSTSDAAAYNPNSTTDFLSKVKALNLTRTFGMYSATAADYPEAVVVSDELPRDPGSYTAKFKVLPNAVADKLSSSQIAAIKAKNGNVYTTVGGSDMLAEGVVAFGEFLDIIRFIDWQQAQIEENVFMLFLSSAKVPMTDKGIALIEGQLRVALEAGKTVGGLSDYDVQVPKVADLSVADRAARRLVGVKFQGTLAGAIHFAIIDGILSV